MSRKTNQKRSKYRLYIDDKSSIDSNSTSRARFSSSEHWHQRALRASGLCRRSSAFSRCARSTSRLNLATVSSRSSLCASSIFRLRRLEIHRNPSKFDVLRRISFHLHHVSHHRTPARPRVPPSALAPPATAAWGHATSATPPAPPGAAAPHLPGTNLGRRNICEQLAPMAIHSPFGAPKC